MTSYRIIQGPSGVWHLRPDPDSPLRVYASPPAEREWINRYCIGAACTGNLCCAVVIDRGEPRPKLDEDHHLLLDERSKPVFLHEGRGVVSQAFGTMPLPEFAELLRRLCFYFESCRLTIIANAQGLALLGEIQKLPVREYMALYLRSGRSDQPPVAWRDRFGFVLAPDNRESFYAVFNKWALSEEGFETPKNIGQSSLFVIRSDANQLPADVTPDTIRVCATCAAIHGALQAQAQGRAPEKVPPRPQDYRPESEREDRTLKGEGAWWGYGLGL